MQHACIKLAQPNLYSHQSTDNMERIFFVTLSVNMKKELEEQITFLLIAALLPCPCWRAMFAISLARAALEKDRKTLQIAKHSPSYRRT